MNAEGKREREYVLARDKECVVKKRDPDHICRRMGMPHRSDNLRLMTVEHVKDKPKVGDPIIKRLTPHRYRAADDRWHMVTMCWDANIGVPSAELRDWIRNVYLPSFRPEVTQ